MGLVTFDICEGNPGAMAFMMMAYKVNLFEAERAFQRMRDNGITGDKLYIIWNDCCDRNTEKALKVMTTRSIEDIVEYINYDGGYGILYEEVTE